MIGTFKKIIDSFDVKIQPNGCPRVYKRCEGGVGAEEEVSLEQRKDEYYFKSGNDPVAVSMLMYYMHYELNTKERIIPNFDTVYDYNTLTYIIVSDPSYTPFFLKGNYYLMQDVNTGESFTLDKITDVCIVLGKRKIDLYDNIFNGELHGNLKVTKLVGNGVSNSLYEGGYVSDDSVDLDLVNKDSDDEKEKLVDLNVY